MTRSILLPAAFVLLSAVTGCSNKNSAVPILILATEADFGTYTGEILKTEGFNEFKLDSLTSGKVTTSCIMQFDLVILAESTIDPPAKEILLEFVKNGGNLIAFRPDPALGELFGIIPAGGNIAEGCIAIDTTTEQGKGLTGETIQFHGIADRYTIKSGKTIAALYTNSVTRSEFPAVVSSNYGQGHTVAFSFNLPKSIVYMRQGNPLHAGKEMDGINGIRAMDLFTDGWLQPYKNTLNQADEQMSLLTHCIEMMCNDLKPLPRFWYFPDTLQCLVTLTNDGEYRSEIDFEDQFRDVDSLGAKMSIYILEGKKVSKDWTDKWTTRGFEISGHPDDTKEAGSPQWNNMNDALKNKKKEIADLYGLTMKTLVNHWFVWCGKDSAGHPEFAAQAELEANHGLAMDANYAHYDNNSKQGHFLGPLGTDQGNFTGSGLVMKFANSKGKILDLYQYLTNVYDQQYTENQDADGFFNCFKGLMDRSIENEVYSFIGIKAHNDEYYFSRKPLLKMLDYANGKHIPVWTAAHLLDYLQMKDEAAFSNVTWSDNHLTFKLTSSLKNTNGLTFLLPARHGDVKISSIAVNGQNTQIYCKSIKGYEYAMVAVTPGIEYGISARYRSF